MQASSTLKSFLYSQPSAPRTTGNQKSDAIQDLRNIQELQRKKHELQKQVLQNQDLEDQIRQLQKEKQTLIAQNNELKSQQQQHEQQITELTERTRQAIEDAEEYKERSQKLEAMKFDLLEKVDQVSAKLLEWQQSYSILYNNFNQRLELETQEIVKKHQEQLDEAEQVKQQLHDMYGGQQQTMNAQITEQQAKIKELDEKCQEYESQIKEYEEMLQENEQLIQNAYKLYQNQNNQEDDVQQMLIDKLQELSRYRDELLRLDQSILEQDQQLSKQHLQLTHIANLVEQIKVDYKASSNNKSAYNSETFMKIQEQLSQKQIQNIELQKEISDLRRAQTRTNPALQSSSLQKSMLQSQLKQIMNQYPATTKKELSIH